MKLSIVTTLYKSERFLEQFITETQNAISLINITDYEIIFVNDGSPDNSLQYLLNKKKEINEIKIVDLSRNFGHHYAIQAGLFQASGDYIFTIDNDLETSPSFLITCFNKIQSDSSIDVVYGYQETRKGKFLENFGGKLFWWLINKISDVKIPENILTERIYTKQYLNSLLSLGDANLFLGGMAHWVGYNQVGIPVEKKIREGKSTYTTRKRIDLMVQAVTSFSGKPLEYLFYSGLFITFFSMIFIIILFILKFVNGNNIQLGWTSLIMINVLILGIITTFLGLMGIYLFKIFRQVQARPNFIIKKIYE
jgi:putative glycosyltransferase